MNFTGALAHLTDEWLYAQIYGPRGDGKWEVRLPKYSRSESLMYGEGTSLEDAILDLLGKVAEVENKDLSDLGLGKVEKGQAELEVKTEAEGEEAIEGYVFAKPQGSAKYHLFDPDGESLCGRATLPEDFDGDVQALGERQPDEETDCKLCLKELHDETAEEQAG